MFCHLHQQEPITWKKIDVMNYPDLYTIFCFDYFTEINHVKDLP